MAHPGLGYLIDNLDITDQSLYSDVMQPFGHAFKLPALAYQSKTFSDLEDESIWSRSWVAIGSSNEIPQKGDLLPYTVGHHGIHVQRANDNSIIARFNKAQHGGCRAVPAQCQTGNKTKCSFTSCGYSRDSKPINNIEIEESNAIAHQYLGVVPERLLHLKTFQAGDYIFVNLDPNSRDNEEPGSLFANKLNQIDQDKKIIYSQWIECEANWKLICNTIFSILEPDADLSKINFDNYSDDYNLYWLEFATNRIFNNNKIDSYTVLWVFPNLFIISFQEYTLSLIIQPTGLRESIIRVLISSSTHNAFQDPLFINSYTSFTDQIKTSAKSNQERFIKISKDKNNESKSIDNDSILEESKYGDYFNKIIAQQISKKNDYYWNVPLFRNVL
ncbi:MAG: ring-hydroxylating oxygenase subunit alpha [Pseudomonadota bacterium]